MKALDLPPVWLVGFLLLAWGLARLTPGLNTQYAWQGPLALVLFGAAVVLMALAVWQMWRARTTVMPRNVPSALVTSGIFSAVAQSDLPGRRTGAGGGGDLVGLVPGSADRRGLRLVHPGPVHSRRRSDHKGRIRR